MRHNFVEFLMLPWRFENLHPPWWRTTSFWIFRALQLWWRRVSVPVLPSSSRSTCRFLLLSRLVAKQFIEMSHADAKLISKISIWCPIRYNELTIERPVYTCLLKEGIWTWLLNGSRTHPRKSRLIYDRSPLGCLWFLFRCFMNTAIDCLDMRKLDTVISRGGGVLPIVGSTGRLCPKGVPF